MNITGHVFWANEVYRLYSQKMKLDKILFLAGNQIPDLATDKKQSHYRKGASVEGLWVPDMELVKKDLFVPEDPVKLGMYSHLYLDYHFIEEFLIPEFVWDVKNRKVINPRNGKEWDAGTFFSPKSDSGMYAAYNEINPLLLRDDYISRSTIEEIPELLPETGIPVFDARREKTWKEELKGYLAKPKEYTGDIFDYDRLCDFIKRLAIKFVKEVTAG